MQNKATTSTFVTVLQHYTAECCEEVELVRGTCKAQAKEEYAIHAEKAWPGRNILSSTWGGN
jgi:hypothetical protein